ncbi:hypothetical protein CSN31_003851 [Salmonella enterica subsp. diarizonae]|nr:hypothetical protein [Salmonella enterica subsp. diarizonae]
MPYSWSLVNITRRQQTQKKPQDPVEFQVAVNTLDGAGRVASVQWSDSSPHQVLLYPLKRGPRRYFLILPAAGDQGLRFGNRLVAITKAESLFRPSQLA